jgi:hypothetical protein
MPGEALVTSQRPIRFTLGPIFLVEGTASTLFLFIGVRIWLIGQRCSFAQIRTTTRRPDEAREDSSFR